MTPKEYLDRYTDLYLQHPVSGIFNLVNINGYGSGWGPEKGCNRKEIGPVCQREYLNYFVPALRHAHHGANTPIGNDKFFFDKRQVANFRSTEDFYVSSFINAFVGKGSPDEMCDTLRIALAVGRIGSGRDAAGNPAARPTLQAYADTYMTLDCNGLTGNFYGVNPQNAVESYANAGRARKRAADVRVGDAVVTIGVAGNYEHVALIEQWTCVGSTVDTGPVDVKIVEWGQAGDESAHYTGAAARRLNAVRKDRRYGIAFSTNDDVTFRYVFAPPGGSGPRGW